MVGQRGQQAGSDADFVSKHCGHSRSYGRAPLSSLLLPAHSISSPRGGCRQQSQPNKAQGQAGHPPPLRAQAVAPLVVLSQHAVQHPHYQHLQCRRRRGGCTTARGQAGWGEGVKVRVKEME